ncbi:SusC/RagA family TonB-linked outer membrane protein [Flavihumibacter solisilvae]|uniref:TonB-dependent receptor n=1 Tax=Flavihumibacter solisilvae TaxID=1349421 RepID=A0A0C1IQV4_9BACT|nr:SusC/RagA family TonB-linked outer membrane protein [Flavihumibacter solisilvae]KIC92854.1 TonB-dependent receptor [Flavihumibacter solisilvae]
MRKFKGFLMPMLLALLCPVVLWAQVSVSGTILDSKNSPVTGASVRLRNSTIGTSTDATGRFSLNIPSNSGQLEISSVGFKSQTITLGTIEVANMSIKLEEDAGKLDEVVVTGLATNVKRRNLANAVATVSSKELAGTAPAQTLDAALNGKIPGAYINSNSGAPGGGISVRLRGVTSIFGNTQPLYVVDGVFIDNSSTPAGLNTVTQAAAAGNPANQDNPSNRISDIRPEDIESIEILKGASASAIYGSKAAAGVVIIATKRGKQGVTRFNISQDLGFVKPRKLLGARPLTEQRVIDQEWNVEEYRAAVAAGKIYDYEKEIYGETGFTRNTNFSMTGGSDKTTFYFSAAQKDEEGIVKYTGYRNSSLRLNVDHRITDNIKVGFTSNYINSSSDRSLTQNDNAGVTLGVALSSTPSFTELHPNSVGEYPDNRYAASNPIQTRDLVTNNEKVNRFIFGINLDAILYKSPKSVTRVVGRGGVDYYGLKTNAQFPSTLQFQEVAKGTSIQGFANNLNTNYIISLVNNWNPSDNLGLTTSLGMTQEKHEFDNLLNTATQVISGQTNVDQAGALTPVQFRTKNKDDGFFIQEEATLHDAITLTGGVRFDKSTNNGDPDKYYAYPKASVSWNLSRLGLGENNLFDNLKVRAAYGEAGNFPAYGSKFTAFIINNIDGLPGSIVDRIRGNAAIEPERQTEFEAGLDFTILNNRLSVEFSWYNKVVKDFLLQRTVPPSSGFALEWVNAGDLRNRGIEIGLNALVISKPNVKWNTTVNFWKNRSEVTKLVIPPTVLGAFGNTLGTFRIEEGASATQIVGIDEGSGGLAVKLGDQEPDFQMNFWNEVNFFKNFTLRFLIHWKQRGDNLNLTELLTDLGGTSHDYDDDKNANRIPDGIDRINQLGVTARPFVQEAGYVKLREIALYYNFKVGWKNIRGIRLGVSANNYAVHTDYKSYDPEVSNFGSGFSTGVEVMPYPSSKRATFHISVDF